MNRLASLALAGLVTVSLAACGGDDRAAGSYRQSAEGPAQADIDNQSPYGPQVEVGKTYDYVYTHCGIEWTRIDGVWWRTTPLNDGNANPPGGWGNPYDAGEVEVIDAETAIYRGGPEAEVEFKRTDTVEAPFTCE